MATRARGPRATAALIALLVGPCNGLDNGLGLRPQLGFNSWNSFETRVNESVMRMTIDAFVSLGLKDAGYEYVSIDDFWAVGRFPNGTLQANPATFPSGIKALADYAHARGLKFGIYSSNSPLTCGHKPGSFGHEELDANTFASWGVDLLKYDNCGDQSVIGPPEQGYRVMQTALNATGRPIFFAACEWAVDFPATWMPAVANTWRTTYDIQNYWECVVSHVDWTNVYADFAGPGAFNDMDILEVGCDTDVAPGAKGFGLSPTEARSHFSLWAIMKAPLMIGCDLSSPRCRAQVPTFANAEVLAINQDALGRQAKRVRSTGALVISKAGMCRKEELPQNTIIAPCADSPLQQWVLQPGGKITMPETGECLQLDSGQGGDCQGDGSCNGGHKWTIWTNNAASALCDDPASCCGNREQLWSVANGSVTSPGPTGPTVVTNQLTGQCLTVHAGGMHNVGVAPCSGAKRSLQSWTVKPLGSDAPAVGGGDGVVAAGVRAAQLVSAAVPPGGSGPHCLARTDDVPPGKVEVWAGPLAGGDVVLLLFNRDSAAPTAITATWADLGLKANVKANVRDVWAKTDMGTFTASFTATAEVHGVRVFRVSVVSK